MSRGGGRVPGLTQEDIEARWARVMELSRRGVRVSDIAHQVGISVTHVHRIRAKFRDKKPRRMFTEAEIAVVESMIEDGASLNEVARTVGRDHSVIVRRWKGCGWDKVSSAEFGALRLKMSREMPGFSDL